MINRNRIRQAVIGAIVGGSLLVAGSAVQRVTIHDPGLWYFAGQLRLAVGDVQGGLRLVSRAAAEQDALNASRTAVNQPEAMEGGSPLRLRGTAAARGKVSDASVEVASAAPGPATISSPDQLRLLQDEFPGQAVKVRTALEAEHQAHVFHRTDYREQVRATLLRVKEELRRQSRDLPETLVPATELPIFPGAGMGSSLP